METSGTSVKIFSPPGNITGAPTQASSVALIVGALRTLAETTTNPSEILSGLNRRLLARSTGFTTCIARRILPGGAATIASAGHLNPYLRGQELRIEANLPLGLTPHPGYIDTPLTLAPGDTLTLLTDGVLEARNPHTGELFGFDRTLAISSQTASNIADTAQRFGQEDDIAVLTLTLLPA